MHKCIYTELPRERPMLRKIEWENKMDLLQRTEFSQQLL